VIGRSLVPKTRGKGPNAKSESRGGEGELVMREEKETRGEKDKSFGKRTKTQGKKACPKGKEKRKLCAKGFLQEQGEKSHQQVGEIGVKQPDSNCIRRE